MSAKTKKRVAGAVAVLAMLALLLTGTFAWKDFSQHKTNPFGGEMKPDVTLNNEFTPPDNWTPASAPVKNKVSVTNTQDSSVPVLVRVRFKEYLQAFDLSMDSYLMDDKGTPADPSDDLPMLFATSADGVGATKGEFLVWDEQAQAQNWLDTYGSTYGPYDYVLVDVDHDNDPLTPNKWFARTQNVDLRNGIYGKPMPDPAVAGTQTESTKDGHLMLFGGAPIIDRGTDQDVYKPQTDTSKEYLTHTWDGKSITNDGTARVDGAATNSDWYTLTTDATHKKISDYISWQNGTSTQQFDVWKTAGELPGNKWVLAEDGWCYWMNGLVPGVTTADVLDSVSLIMMPGDALKYEIQTELQAVTSDELTAFDNMPTEIETIMQSLAQAMVQRAALEGLIAEIENMNPDLYTANSWAALQTELSSAKITAADPEADLAALTTAVTDLRGEKEALKQKPDLEPLQKMLDKIGALNETTYTPTSWTPLKTKVDAAYTLMDNQDASAEDVAAMITDLKTAQTNLKKRADFSKLNAAIAKAEDGSVVETDWSAATWTAFQTALTDGKAKQDPNSSQAEVDSAAFALTQAQKALRADKAALDTLIGQCDALDPNDWKLSTWTPFMEALNQAKIVSGKPEAKNSDVASVKTALETAKAALEALPKKGGLITLDGGTAGPTQWRVLDIQNGEALLISEDILESRQWNTTAAYVAWSASPMRNYLNSEGFLDKYFSATEQTAIKPHDVSTDKAYNDTSQNISKDSVFLLSEAEAKQYFTSDADRIAKLNGGTSYWWLRSPRHGSAYAGNVSPAGSFGGNDTHLTNGVRPALWVDLSSIS